MEVSELVRSLLEKRGIKAQDVPAFLEPDYDLHLQSPMLLSDMEKALVRFFSALEKKERIAVYADYDADGIGGAVVLSDFLKRMGHEQFEVYFPHRDLEGYGFHVGAVEDLAARGALLIITTDVGISGVAAAKRARELGVDVIITDHHEVMSEIPETIAVIDPKLSDYPFPHLCGAAVAWKFVQAALAEGKRRELSQFRGIQDGWEKWLLDVVALSTVSDMVPLVGENRALVHFGLRVLRRSPRPGIRALCDSTRIRQREITEDDIGFSLCPRINAASRMDEAHIAFELLTTQDTMEAARIAKKLEELNAQRKGIVAGIVKQAKKRARERFVEQDRVAVLGDTAWKPSLLGLAANSLVQERGGVVCLWGRDGSGALKGSCRSDGALSLVDLFANAGDAFEQFGGHANSGGFTVSNERVHSLQEDLARAAEASVAAPSKVDGLKHEASIPLSAVSQTLLQDISKLSPFGMGNKKPVFLIAEIKVTQMKRFGKEKNHVEFMVHCPKTGISVRAFEFFKGPEHFTALPQEGASANILATLERDNFRGQNALALRIVDVLPSC